MDTTSLRRRRSLVTVVVLALALASLLGDAGVSAAKAPPTVATPPTVTLPIAAPAPPATWPRVAAPADFSTVGVRLVLRASGLSGPVQVTNAADGTGRLFIVEQRGVIKIYSRHRIQATPFLDMRSMVSYGGERGLLALAFPSNFEQNHRFYVLFTERGTGDVIVGLFKTSTTNRNRAVLSSFRRVLRVGHRTHTNHNGGMLAFGPDGMLYVSIGDGGGAGDTANNAQSLRTRLGKILRIQVSGRLNGHAYLIPPSNPWASSTVYAREIWSRGLRNPWRYSFDRLTGDLWIGDVGQDAWEEVDHATRASGNARAANFGWHVMEGNACYQPSSGCDQTGLTLPIAVYDHGQGCAIIGGYVYRGAEAILQGAYLFSDVCSGTIWSLDASVAGTQTPVVMASTSLGITSFGESESGSLFITAQNGRFYQVTGFAR